MVRRRKKKWFVQWDWIDHSVSEEDLLDANWTLPFVPRIGVWVVELGPSFLLAAKVDAMVRVSERMRTIVWKTTEHRFVWMTFYLLLSYWYN